jgi:site-specific recombinase XerD
MDAFEAYRQELLQRDIEPATRERYLQVGDAFKAWLAGREPTATLAQGFLADLRNRGYRQRSVILYYHVLRQLLTTRGESFKLRLRKPQDLPRWFDQGDTDGLLAQAKKGIRAQKPWQRQRNYALVLALRDAGLRRGEVVGLRVADVDFRRRTLRVTGKGAKDRVIPMTQRLLIALWELCSGKNATDPVFGLNGRSVYRIITRLAREAGLEGLHPHTLRHSFGTELVSRGAYIKAVAELVGHADITTTSVYLRTCPQHLRAAIELLDDSVGDNGARESHTCFGEQHIEGIGGFRPPRIALEEFPD